MKSPYVLLLAVGLLLPLRVQAIPPPPPQWQPPAGLPRPGVIVGTVSEADGAPASVAIQIRQYTRGSLEATVAADAQGDFVARGLPFGRYRLMVRGDLADDVEITTRRTQVRVRLTASPVATIEGVVRNQASGLPVSGALVVMNLRSRSPEARYDLPQVGDVYEWAQHAPAELEQFAREDGAPFTKTDAAGRYTLPLLDRSGSMSAGEYGGMPTDGRGLLFAIAPDRALFPARREIRERVRGHVTLDFALNPTDRFRLRGRIILPNGAPYANGAAKLWLRHDPDETVDLTTDAQGRYSVLPPALYDTVGLQVLNYARMHRRLSSTDDAPMPALDWPLRPQQTGTLTVRVLRRDGKTAAPDGSSVNCIRDTEASPKEPETRGSGPQPVFYTLQGADDGAASATLSVHHGRIATTLDPGTYWLYTAPRPLTRPERDGRPAQNWYGSDYTNDFLAQFFPGVGALRFTISPNRETAFTYTEPDLAAITITVRGPDGRPIPNVAVAAVRWDAATRSYPGFLGGPATDTNGHALFDPLVPGTYSFEPHLTSNNDTGIWRYAVTLQPGRHTFLNITLLPQDRAAALRRAATVTVHGVVFLPDGRTPAAFAALYTGGRKTETVDEGVPAAFSDAQGRFTLDGVAAHGVLFARSDATALTAFAVRTDMRRLVLQRGATLSGQVLPTGRVSLTDLSVFAAADPPGDAPHSRNGQLQTTPVRPDGSFTLYEVGAGQKRVALYRAEKLQPDAVALLALHVGETRSGVDLTAQPQSAGLEIAFHRADGTPLPDSFAFYLFNGYSAACACGLTAREGIARTGPLPPGTYQLWIDAASFSVPKSLSMPPGLIKRDIVVAPGGTLRRIDVVVPNGGALHGRVVFADGKTPARDIRVAVHVEGAPAYSDDYPPHPWLTVRSSLPSYAETLVAPDGSFTLFGLAPGRYAIEVDPVEEVLARIVNEPAQVTAGKVTDVGTLRLHSSR